MKYLAALDMKYIHNPPSAGCGFVFHFTTEGRPKRAAGEFHCEAISYSEGILIESARIHFIARPKVAFRWANLSPPTPA
jgi:hypothetical protein